MGRPAGGLGQTDTALEAQPHTASHLPVTQLGGNIKRILHHASPDCAAILFEHINRLTSIARQTELDKLYEESMAASNLAGRLAIKTIELTVGKQLNIQATVTSQSSIPKWDQLPADVQAKWKPLLNELANLPEADTHPVIEGEVAPKTLDEKEGLEDDPPETPRET